MTDEEEHGIPCQFGGNDHIVMHPLADGVDKDGEYTLVQCGCCGEEFKARTVMVLHPKNTP